MSDHNALLQVCFLEQYNQYVCLLFSYMQLECPDQRIYISNRTDSTLLRLPNICPPNLSLPESMSSVKTWKFETGKKGLFFSGFD